MCLSKNLLAQAGELKLPPMLVKVKTPDLPLHLAGDTRRDDLTWNIVAAKEGLVAKGVDAENQLRAFVVSEDKMKEAFALLKQLVVDGFPALRRKRLSRATVLCRSPAKRKAGNISSLARQIVVAAPAIVKHR